jgi:hypothetical protein
LKTRLTCRSYSRRAKWVVYPTSVLVTLNFFVFIGGSTYLGGDALNGYIQAGHHFLCAHGHCTEVSASTWHYSYWHAVTALGGILLVFAELALFLNTGDIEFE